MGTFFYDVFTQRRRVFSRGDARFGGFARGVELNVDVEGRRRRGGRCRHGEERTTEG